MKKKMIHEIMHVLVVKLSNCFIVINSRGSGKNFDATIQSQMMIFPHTLWLELHSFVQKPCHYLDLSTQPNEPEKWLTSNIHLLSPQKWSQFFHLDREKIFPRGQP